MSLFGAFITSYAREVTQRTAQAIYDYSMKKYGKNYYVYSDTDSIHTLLSIEELQQFCKIDDYKLGYWAYEELCQKAKYIRQKCYIHDVDGEIKITCAGMPDRCYSQVNWDNFKEELTVGGKLTFKHVKGGVILVETDYTIKPEKIKLKKNKKGVKKK